MPAFNGSKNFSVAEAKEWYYGVFKKTAEWASSPAHGKKLPDWEHTIYRKLGEMEILEFPLKKEISTFVIAKDNTLSSAEQKRIASASLSRIVFIKKGNTITLREIDYVPDWAYLQQNNFDISHVSINKLYNGFSGRLYIKAWNGEEKGRYKVKDGVIYKKLRLAKKHVNTRAQNTTTCTAQLCHYTQQCWMYVSGDVITGFECGEWKLEYCEAVEVEGDCDNEGDEDLCLGLSDQDCACQVYGMGCSGDDGGGDDDGGQCNMTEDEGQSVLAGITLEHSSEETTTDGAEFTDSDGIIRKPHGKDWKFLTLNILNLGRPEYTAKFSGVVWKANHGDRWKWETFTFNHIVQTGGTLPTCTSVNANGSASIAIGDYTAVVELSSTFVVTIICAGANGTQIPLVTPFNELSRQTFSSEH